MNCWAEYPIVDHAAWRKGECAGNQNTADVKADHVSTVCLDVASTHREVGCRGAVQRDKAEHMDETKMVQKPRSDLGLHQQSRYSSQDHQREIDAAKSLVKRRAFSPQQQERADEKRGQYRRQVEIDKFLVCHGGGRLDVPTPTAASCPSRSAP